MSFTFGWQTFSKEEPFLRRCKDLLTDALNRNTPRIIEGEITVQDLNWGSEAPILEILEIGDVASDRFRGIFKLNYEGSASMTLATKVQANLLNVYEQTSPAFTTPTFVGAPVGLSIPLNLTLSEIVLSGIVILVFSKARGLTLVFRNDPLVSIKVSSTFDSFSGIASFLQLQIEDQIRVLFREELPAILYRHSQQWTPAGQAELMAKVVAAQRHQEQQAHLVAHHNELRRQLQEEDDETSPGRPVTFAEIDQEKQVSLVNMLHIQAMTALRSTLSTITPTVPTAVLRSEISRRAGTSESLGSVDLTGEAIYDHVHSQAIKIASRSNHKPRRRILKLNKKIHDSTPIASWAATPTSQETVSESVAGEKVCLQDMFETAVLHEKKPPKGPSPPYVEALKSGTPKRTTMVPVPHYFVPAKVPSGPGHFFTSNVFADSKEQEALGHQQDPPAYVA